MRIHDNSCISLIGMAGAGKSTLAPLLARHLDWACMDTDRLIEAHYGRELQELLDSLGKEGFLDCENTVVSTIAVQRCVISTGGSVVYSPKAMSRLMLLGPVIHLRVPVNVFLSRVGDATDRGFVRRGGNSLVDVYEERMPLYEKYADLSVDTDAHSPEECARRITDWLKI